MVSDLRHALTEALGPLYRVEREVRPIGDYRLFVATQSPPIASPTASAPQLLIKVLPSALSLGIDDLQFERSVLLLAEKLKHPHLVRPRGAGRAASFVYHTRPFVPGTTLRAWIGNNGAVPLSRAVDIIRNILSGLEHAHAQQIAHGDLKAENVLLADEGVLVADTGIAHSLGKRATMRDDMIKLQALTREMLTGRAPRELEEPLETSRALPQWLNEWMRSRWTDAGRALAAMRPPPPPSSQSSQLFA